MHKPPHVIEIYLQPGELWFGDENTRIRTILGSCVALTLWHPTLRIGGMCHYMLPGRANPGKGKDLDGRYAEEAIERLLQEIRAAGAHPRDFVAKLFGGGHMFQHHFCDGRSCSHQVHHRNIDVGRALVAKHGFQLKAEHVGGHGHRQVILDLWNGHAWLRHTPLPNGSRCPLEERTS